MVLNEAGYAELLFSYPEDEEFRNSREARDLVIPPRTATMQTTEELKRLDVAERDFTDGMRAEITGWPATDLQSKYSELLIDELYIIEGNSKFAAEALRLHPDNEEMIKFSQKGEDPDDPKPGEEPPIKVGP